ncbi:MAG: DUF1540 domain-containing protein [Clostridiaceae bacterium]|nr:DUF1540 domain-containing protein [Clostridiaceae bacterium]
MNRICCDVSNCSHNKENICYANRVNIGGKSAEKDMQTCCGSYLNKLLYSDLTNNINSAGSCDSLVCYVETCQHNCNNLCNLEQIDVSGLNANVYEETLCNSFKKR